MGRAPLQGTGRASTALLLARAEATVWSSRGKRPRLPKMTWRTIIGKVMATMCQALYEVCIQPEKLVSVMSVFMSEETRAHRNYLAKDHLGQKMCHEGGKVVSFLCSIPA